MEKTCRECNQKSDRIFMNICEDCTIKKNKAIIQSHSRLFITPTYRVVKYRGDNCNPCKVLAPIFEEAKGRNTREDIEFHEVNIAEDEAGVERLKIRSIPTIIIFKGDEELARKNGVQMPNELKEWIYNVCK